MMSKSIALPVLMHHFGKRIVHGLREDHVCQTCCRVGRCDQSCEFSRWARDRNRARHSSRGASSARFIEQIAELLRELRVTLSRTVGRNLEGGRAEPLVVSRDVALE